MKILFLSPANSIHTVRWVNSLVERGHNVFLVSLVNHRNQENNIYSKVVLYELPISGAKGYYLNAIWLHRLEEKIKPDVVNVHYASGYGTLMRMAGLKNAVLSVWGSDVYDFPYRNWICMRIMQKNLNYAKRIASTSYSMAEQVRKILHRNLDIAITPFGVDLKQFIGKGINEKSGRITIGCIKVLEQKYGINYLIEAIKLLLIKLEENGLKDVANKICCRIYGDGSQKEMLQNLIDNLGVTDVISLKGKISHEKVPSVLSEMDIFCVLSELDSESFGVAAVEASAQGIPVVASDVSGFREVIEDGVTGMIVKRKSPKAAEKALEVLVLDRDLCIRMGQEGRKRVEKLYDWEENVGEMEKVYISMYRSKSRMNKNEKL